MYVQELAFLQGDDASEFFGVLYPKGMQYEPRKALAFMLERADGDEERPVTATLGFSGHSGMLTTKYHVLQWSYPHNWVALYVKVTKKQLKEMGWKETRNRELVKG